MAEARATDLSPRETPGASTSAVKAMQAEGRYPEARERYADLVGRHQRRASQIAFHYLRDDAAADEAVQDAFVEAYAYLASLPEELPFELWLNRILINGCLDRLKARTPRWLSTAEPLPGHSVFTERAAGNLPSLEEEVLARERPQRVCGAVACLPARQLDLYVEPLSRVRVAGSERPDKVGRVDRSQAPVSRSAPNRQAGVGPWARKNQRLATSVAAR